MPPASQFCASFPSTAPEAAAETSARVDQGQRAGPLPMRVAVQPQSLNALAAAPMPPRRRNPTSTNASSAPMMIHSAIRGLPTLAAGDFFHRMWCRLRPRPDQQRLPTFRLPRRFARCLTSRHAALPPPAGPSHVHAGGAGAYFRRHTVRRVASNTRTRETGQRVLRPQHGVRFRGPSRSPSPRSATRSPPGTTDRSRRS